MEQLRGCGFSALQLMQECSCSIVDVRAAGYTAAECMACGIAVKDMSSVTTLAGRVVRGGCYTLQQLHCAGASAQQAVEAGFTVLELQAAGRVRASCNASTSGCIAACCVAGMRVVVMRALQVRRRRRVALLQRQV